MKRILVITVFAVLLMSTVGATTTMAAGPTKTALSCEVSPEVPPPVVGDAFNITGVLTYGTASDPIQQRLITVYSSPDAKKWTEVDAVNTNETGWYTVTTSQDTAGTYYYKAVFVGDKIFQKVTSETRSVRVNPLAGSGSHPFVTELALQNNGWFVAKLACYYSTDGGITWKESSHTSGIVKGELRGADLSELGVPDDALVKIHVIVVGGKDRTGSDVFHYTSLFDNRATYYIYGPVWDPELMYMGLICPLGC